VNTEPAAGDSTAGQPVMRAVPATMAEQLAGFVARTSYADLSETARDALKIRLLDALGCAIGALGADPMRRVRQQLDDFGGTGHCTLIGGGRTAPDRAAFYNSALVRYLDFNDAYLAPGETCHPSDNIGAVLAAAEYARASGREFLAALAVAYQVQCRLSDVAPVRARGFDHTTQGAYAVAAGVAKALALEAAPTTSALGICGTAFNALRVTRTGALSNWKGLAFPNTAFGCTHATFLAMRGITGPRAVFEGAKGFMEAIAGEFEIDWAQEDLERVTRTILKRYNAEIHSQATLEGVLELRARYGLRGEDVAEIAVDTFDVAYHIIGGGEEGEKTTVRTKEEADHSLPYMVASALLDGRVMPDQYAPERIRRRDIQSLLRKVVVRPSADLSGRFPEWMPCRVRIRLVNGQAYEIEKQDYEGFHSRPMRWETAREKFESLTAAIDAGLRSELADAVSRLDGIPVTRLTRLLERITPEHRA
jgi:2-methylcitrate dehydratase